MCLKVHTNVKWEKGKGPGKHWVSPCAHMRAHTPTHQRVCPQACTHTRMQSGMLAHMHTCTLVYTHAQTHTCRHAHMHTRTRTYACPNAPTNALTACRDAWILARTDTQCLADHLLIAHTHTRTLTHAPMCARTHTHLAGRYKGESVARPHDGGHAWAVRTRMRAHAHMRSTHICACTLHITYRTPCTLPTLLPAPASAPCMRTHVHVNSARMDQTRHRAEGGRMRDTKSPANLQRPCVHDDNER